MASATAALVILIVGGIYSVHALEPTSSYSKAIAFVKGRGDAKHLATFFLISQVYAGVNNVPREWPSSEDELRHLYTNGYRYFVVDWMKDVIDVALGQFNLAKKAEKFAAVKRRVDVINHIEARIIPAFTCPNKHLENVSTIFEVNLHFIKTIQYFRAIKENPKVNTIRVYDLREYFEPNESQGKGSYQKQSSDPS
jgi:hypothetical protein